MDTSNMLLPEDLPFPVSPELIQDVNELNIAYQEDNEIDVAEIRQEIYGDGRALSEYQDDLIREYYVYCGWMDYPSKEAALHGHFSRSK